MKCWLSLFNQIWGPQLGTGGEQSLGRGPEAVSCIAWLVGTVGMGARLGELRSLACPSVLAASGCRGAS